MHTSHLSVSTLRTMGPEQDRPTTGASSSGGDVPEHSVHMRSRSTAHAQSPKRLSVFSGRSRSNTTNSTTTTTTSSSRRSPASSMTSTDAASLPPSQHSQEERSGSAAGMRTERQESMTKSLFSRGSRILRRQGSKFNIVATVDEAEEVEREKPRFEVTDIFTRHHKSRQSNAHDQLKSLISDPFDFHHLTHTSPSHFQELDRTRETDLVTEFSAIRASQRPVTGLKGIRAEDLHFQNFSSEDLTSCPNCVNCGTTMNHGGPDAISPPASPCSSPAASPKYQDGKPSRESRTFENFSRPVSRIPRMEVSTPLPRAASPRLAASPEFSEPAPRAIDEILGLSTHQTYPEHVYNQSEAALYPASSPIHVDGMFPSAGDPAAAASLNQDVTHVRTGSVSFTSLASDLDDVPEEEECATHWHDSPESTADERAVSRCESQLGSPSEVRPDLQDPPKSHLSVYVSERLTQKFSEALGSPTLPQFRENAEVLRQERARGEHIRRQSSIHRRPTYETIYESWDADIDYCYEHAAESNSNFDWARNSVDESRSERVEVSITVPQDGPVQSVQEHRTLSVHHLSTSTLATPDLDPSPSRSVPSSHFVATPSTTSYEGQRDGDYFQPVSSSIFPATLGKHLTQDTLYDEYLATDAESDRHFSFCSQGVIQHMEHPVSPRSSFSPISKCNSEESLILSRAASIVRKHRSSVSTVSVPELVHSLANSRELPHVSSSERLSSGLSRPDSSSHHRQTKSLARELEAYRLEGNSTPESTGLVPSPSPSIHDRAKSTSEVETAPLTSKASKVSAHRSRKGRTSYSLFPAPPTN